MALRAGRVGVARDQVNQQGKIIAGGGDIPVKPEKHIYSTTPQIVGEWIDGRPVFQLTTPIDNQGVSEDLSTLNIDRVIKTFGGGSTLPILYDVTAVSGTNGRAVYYSTTDNRIHCDGTYRVDYVIIEYIQEVM